MSSLPASSGHTALYMVELLLSAETSAPVDAACVAITWAHRRACLRSPCDAALVRQTLLSRHRLLARPAQKKKPMPMSQIEQLVSHYDQPCISLLHLQMVTLILLGFHGFIRWDDMARL